MPRVHTTKEYEKCREGLLTRGKIGKDAYDKARVAEAEAIQGTIRTVSRTHHGEDRIPDAEKYDLPGDYRLVVQRVNGFDPGRVFLFVGSHDDAEQWLENHRGLRWQPKPSGKQTPDPVSQLEQEKQRLQQELKKRQSEQQQLAVEVEGLERQNGELADKLNARDKDFERLAAQVKELEGKQAQIEAERQQALRQRELLAEQQRQLASEKARLKADLQRSTSELVQLSTRVSQLERENQRLRKQLAGSPAAPGSKPPGKPPNHRWAWGAAIAGGATLLLAIGLLANGCSRSRSGGNESGNEKEKQAEVKNPEAPRRPVIQPAEAHRWEGQEVTVRVVVKSTHDGFDWAFMINSEEDFKHPDNFTVVVEKESAGAKYKEKGVSSLGQYFTKNTVLLVKGKIEKYKDKRSGKARYQIRVKDPEQIQRQ
jgi:hypothetical protein